MTESTVRWSPTDENYPPKEKGLLTEEEKEEYEGLSPLAMGLLQAGASMMRNSGWRNRPMTTSEMIGHAIPAGIGGYYNQDVRNQQEEANFIAQQQAKQQAEEQARLLESKQKQEQAQMQSMLLAVDRLEIKNERKRFLKEQIQMGGKFAQDAYKVINDILGEKTEGSYGDVEFGTFGKGHANSLKLMDKQGLTAPDGAVDLNILPVKSGEKVIGYKTEWLNAHGLPITESKEEKEAKGYKYVDVRKPEEKIEFSKEYGSMPIADDANTMIIDKDGKVESYIDTLGRTYDFSMDLTDRAESERKLAKEVNVGIEGFRANSNDPRIAEWFNEDGTSKINIPEGTVNVKILTDGDIQFLGADNQPIDLQTMVVGRYNKKTGSYHNVLVNKETGVDIKDLGVSKAYEEPREVWQHNIDKQEKETKKKSFKAYLADIQETYGIPAGQIEEWLILSNSDFDSALSQATNFAKFQAQALGVVRSGKQLNEDKRYPNIYTDERYYKQTDDGDWIEYDPASSTRFAGENAIRKEYNMLTRDHRIASRGYDGIMSGLNADSGFGDIMAITSFRIMFEPNSVVREAEFEITANAGGWLEKFLNNPDQFMDGDRLSETAREQMHTLVQDYMQAIQKRSDQHYQTFTKLGKDRKFNTDSIVDPFKDHNFKKDWNTFKKDGYISTGKSDSIRQTINKDDNALTLAQRIRQNTARRKKK